MQMYIYAIADRSAIVRGQSWGGRGDPLRKLVDESIFICIYIFKDIYIYIYVFEYTYI